MKQGVPLQIVLMDHARIKAGMVFFFLLVEDLLKSDDESLCPGRMAGRSL